MIQIANIKSYRLEGALVGSFAFQSVEMGSILIDHNKRLKKSVHSFHASCSARKR